MQSPGFHREESARFNAGLADAGSIQPGNFLDWELCEYSVEGKSRNPDGGQDYPEKILREPKRNIRVWLQDGSGDLENRYGSWALANLRMANALKQGKYDFHLSFGKGSHNSAHGARSFRRR